MPLPLLFIGVAAATGSVGVGKTIKAGVDTSAAKQINKSANEMVEEAAENLNEQRTACGNSLNRLGEEKLFILNSSLTEFLDTFSKIKNVNFRETEGLNELSKVQIDQKDFEELKEMVSFAGSVAKGAVAGTAGGTLVAFGAYGAAQMLATASTGTAIASLSGAAATNATLAFFGGGSMASGGLGMAVGHVVLGGLVAGPALLVLGLSTGSAAKKNLEQASINKSEAMKTATELDTASRQCETIRRRTYMFYNLLARLDSYFLPFIYQMEDIMKNEGDEYRNYSAQSRKVIASCASLAVSIKAVLDTQLLTDDGLLTEESQVIVEKTERVIENLEG